MTSRLLCTSNNTCQLIVYRSNGRVDVNDGQVARSFVRSFSSEAKRCAMNNERRGNERATTRDRTLGNIKFDRRSSIYLRIVCLASNLSITFAQLTVSFQHSTNFTHSISSCNLSLRNLNLKTWLVSSTFRSVAKYRWWKPEAFTRWEHFLFSRAERSTSNVIRDYEQKI